VSAVAGEVDDEHRAARAGKLPILVEGPLVPQRITFGALPPAAAREDVLATVTVDVAEPHAVIVSVRREVEALEAEGFARTLESVDPERRVRGPTIDDELGLPVAVEVTEIVDLVLAVRLREEVRFPEEALLERLLLG